MTTRICIADFSRYPCGRYLSDGPYSAELFREAHLIPALKKGPVIIELAGTHGYPISFIEEAFGGLVRSRQFPGEDFEEKLTLVFTGEDDILDVMIDARCFILDELERLR